MRKTIWDWARERAGEDLADVTPHDLRHMCASLMRAASADVKAIQQQLGHRSTTVTLNTYTHLFEGDMDEIMERLDVHSAIHSAIKSRPKRVLGEVVDPSQKPKRSLTRRFVGSGGETRTLNQRIDSPFLGFSASPGFAPLERIILWYGGCRTDGWRG